MKVGLYERKEDGQYHLIQTSDDEGKWDPPFISSPNRIICYIAPGTPPKLEVRPTEAL